MTTLESLLGNKTAERALLFIHSHGRAHAARIASSFHMPRAQVLKQLVRLEQGGILKGEYIGKARVFSISERCIFRSELQQLLEKVFLTLPPTEARPYQKQNPLPAVTARSTETGPARKSEILRRLSQERDNLIAIGIQSLFLFGSVARDEAKTESDVDICYELSVRPNLANIARVEESLKRLLAPHRLDLVIKASLRPEVLANAEKEMVRVF